MIRIASGPGWVAHGPEHVNVAIRLKGRIWRFDFDEWCGPLWLLADGWRERKNQDVPKAVWRAFDRRYKTRTPRTPANFS
jgi:hypothetical protein